MADQIIKQPNGLYCRYSSITERIEEYNCTPESIIETFVDWYRESISKSVHDIVQKLNKGEKPYHQFTISFEEALEKSSKRMNPDIFKLLAKDVSSDDREMSLTMLEKYFLLMYKK